MQQNNNRNVSALSETIGIVLLLLHVYFYCYPLFVDWRLVSGLTDDILRVIIKTGLFHHPWYSKSSALVFMLMGIVASPHRKQPAGPWQKHLILLAIGIMGYCCCGPMPWMTMYLVITGVWLFWMMYQAGRLARH